MKSRRKPKLVLFLAILSIIVFVFFLVYGLITKIWWVGGPGLLCLESLRLFNVNILLSLGLIESITLLIAYINHRLLSVLESIISSGSNTSGLSNHRNFYEVVYEKIIFFAKFMALSNLAILLVVNVLATMF